MNKLNLYKEKTFDEIKHIDSNGYEYWEAREIMVVLGYYKWGNFKKVIDKSKTACNISNNNIDDHFADIGKTVPMPSGAKPKIIEDFKLSRYACYLIV